MPETMYRVMVNDVPAYFLTYQDALDFVYGTHSPKKVIRLVYTDCDRCMNNDNHDVSHNNCMYDGMRIGHSRTHCTAGGCW